MHGIGRLFLLLAALGLLACSSEDLTESERALLLTEADFREFTGAPEAAAGGKYRKTINPLDGTRDLTYELEKKGSSFFLTNSLKVDSSAIHARMTEESHKIGLQIGFSAWGVTEEPLVLRVKYGDRSSLALLKKDGKPIGNTFTAAAGKNVYVMTVAGVYFQDVDAFDQFIGGRMDAILKYDAAK